MPCEERRPFIPEWSDTELVFHVTEKTSCWDENDVDLTEYNSVVLKIKYSDWEIVEYPWDIDSTNKFLVTFTVLWESSTGRSGEFKAEVWWVKDAQKHRFNKLTIIWDVLASIDIPSWATVNG